VLHRFRFAAAARARSVAGSAGHAELAAAPGACAPACSRARCAQSRSTRTRRRTAAHSSCRVRGACLRRLGAPGASATRARATSR
jgi:hypothetical protein